MRENPLIVDDDKECLADFIDEVLSAANEWLKSGGQLNELAAQHIEKRVRSNLSGAVIYIGIRENREDTIKRVMSDFANGSSVKEIASRYGCCRRTIYRYIKKAKEA